MLTTTKIYVNKISKTQPFRAILKTKLANGKKPGLYLRTHCNRTCSVVVRLLMTFYCSIKMTMFICHWTKGYQQVTGTRGGRPVYMT